MRKTTLLERILRNKQVILLNINGERKSTETPSVCTIACAAMEDALQT